MLFNVSSFTVLNIITCLIWELLFELFHKMLWYCKEVILTVIFFKVMCILWFIIAESKMVSDYINGKKTYFSPLLFWIPLFFLSRNNILFCYWLIYWCHILLSCYQNWNMVKETVIVVKLCVCNKICNQVYLIQINELQIQYEKTYIGRVTKQILEKRIDS